MDAMAPSMPSPKNVTFNVLPQEMRDHILEYAIFPAARENVLRELTLTHNRVENTWHRWIELKQGMKLDTWPYWLEGTDPLSEGEEDEVASGVDFVAYHALICSNSKVAEDARAVFVRGITVSLVLDPDLQIYDDVLPQAGFAHSATIDPAKALAGVSQLLLSRPIVTWTKAPRFYLRMIDMTWLHGWVRASTSSREISWEPVRPRATRRTTHRVRCAKGAVEAAVRKTVSNHDEAGLDAHAIRSITNALSWEEEHMKVAKSRFRAQSAGELKQLKLEEAWSWVEEHLRLKRRLGMGGRSR